MPPFFDGEQMHRALENQAMPILEALAANDNFRNRSVRRFDNDDPPPYTSSTESSEHEFFVPSGTMPEELRALMEEPLSDEERVKIAYYLQSALAPYNMYHTEAKAEERRLGRVFFLEKGLAHHRRCGVLVRHNVKRRWEKLGVWNPEWGFPGRNAQPNDDFGNWEWKWQLRHVDGSESRSMAADAAKKDGKETVTAEKDPQQTEAAEKDMQPCLSTREQREQAMLRALRLRQNLRRGESVAVIPRSHLAPDATASEAESFIISRPWFTYKLEVAEEETRYRRISLNEARRYPHAVQKQVVEWWEKRQDWRGVTDTANWATSWKWRHESPPPEPEQFTTMDMVDWSPSEIDALEAIDLPASEQPKKFWAIWRDDWPPYFPGQMLDPNRGEPPKPYQPDPDWVPLPYDLFETESPPRSEPSENNASPQDTTSPQDPSSPQGTPSPQDTASPQVPPSPQDTASPQDIISLQHSSPQVTTGPQETSALQKPRRQRGRVNKAQDRHQPLLQARRSARIAAMKRPAETLPSQSVPNKKARVRATSKAASSTAPQHAPESRRPKKRPVPEPSETELETQPKRRSARLRKEMEPDKPGAVKKPANTRISRRRG